jgi:AraC family transcriptional regulator
MVRSTRENGASALSTLRSAIGVAPELAGLGWTSVTACLWRTPWIASYELSEMSETIVALHTGGNHGVRARVRGRPSTLGSNPGHVHLIPAGLPIVIEPQGQIEFATIHIAPDRLRHLADEDRSLDTRLSLRFAFRDSFVSACVRALMDEVRVPRGRGPLFVDSVADALLVHLARPLAVPEPSRSVAAMAPRALARVRERIEASLEAGISLDELAAEAGLSRFHFARAFRQAMDVPPHRYLTLRRIERAKDLLLHTDLPLADVALAIGFSSQSHFTLRFREEVGETPKRFRSQR